jgi:FtsH-binding integral membrane protein
MENNFQYVSSETTSSASMSKTFMANVFSWMFAALGLTAIVAYMFSQNMELVGYLVTEKGLSTLGYVVMFAPLGFVLAMSIGFARFSLPVLMFLFIAYSVIMGISLSFIFLAYTMSSIFLTFAIAAGMFGVMAVMGYTTKTDLTRFGSLMMMGLFGIIIASLVNFFMKSDTMDYIISLIGVAVFTGLAAYDVQKLKRIGAGAEYGTANTSKLAIMGALSLYLDFINLFLMLLRFFGDRRN